MRTPSGELHVVDFKTEQIVASIQPKDYWDDKRHWEIKNNIDTLEFRVFDNTKHSATLMQQNLVLKEVRDGRIVPYVITEIEKDSDDRSVIAYASGEWVQLAKAGIIPPQTLEGKTVIEMVEIALAGTKWKKGNLEYASFRSMTIDEFIDPLTLLKKIASLFELEIQYRAEVIGSQVVRRYVDMIKKRGRETGKEVTLGKDLMGIKRIENSQNICTALLGFVKKEGGEFVTITEINNGVPYLADSDAFQRWNEKGQHKFGFYSPETEDQDMSPKRLMTLMNTELKKRVNTSVSYEVQAQSIGRVFGLAHELINEGDTIRIKDTGFTPKLYLEARVIAGDESFTDPTQDKYVFGDYHEIVDPNEELRKIYNRILSSLGNKQEMIDQLDKLVKDANETASNAKKESEAAKTLAEKVQENIKNNTVEIIESKNPPTTGLKDRKTLWLDISNGKPGILKLWKDGIWDPVVPDVEKVKKETLEQVNKDIESTKTELNQKVQTVENKAKEIAGQVADVQKEVGNKVDKTWIDSQLKDKADKSGVYTKDEIKDGFIGKQVYETDKLGNVKKFQDINTSIGQTNEALTQKAEKSELKKTSEGLSQLEQKTNEITTTADSTKQTLTQLKTQVDNTKVGGRNLLVKGDLEKTNSREFVKYTDLAPIIDLHGLIEYTISFDIKVAVPGDVQVYMQNGSGAKYKFSENVNATTQYERRYITVTPTLDNKTLTESWLSFFGTYDTGRLITVKNVKVEKGNVPTEYSPAPEEQTSVEEFTKKTVEIETTIKGIYTSVSNIQNEQGKLTERVTKSEQTADGFKQSIESLTKKDSEISDKLNTVESTVEGTKKTISDIQSDTTSLKQTTTEIKEQAGKISEKLTEVTGKVINLKPGGRNFLLNTDFKRYITNDKRGWDNALNGTLQLSNWQGEFNGGVQQPEKGYHAHLDEKKFGYPVLAMISKNSFIGLPGRWLGLNQTIIDDFKKGDIAGKEITISMDIWTENGSNNITGGPYHFIEGNTNQTFHSGQFSIGVDKMKKWVRYSQTLKLHDKYDVSKGAQFYIYGHTGSEGERYIKNVQIEIGNIATEWQPAPEENVSTDEFTKKTTDIEKSVDGVKTTVTNVQNSQSGFEKRMTTVEQTASGLSSTVTNLNNVVSDQGKKLTDANSKIEQQAKEIGAKVAIKEVEDYVAGFKIPELKTTVNKNKEDLLGELANKLATEQYNQKMTLIDNRFSVNEKGIDLAAKKTEVYTQTQTDGKFASNAYVRDMEGRIQVTEKNILSTVKKGEVISSINQTAEKIKISADLIDLVGKVEASWLKAGLLQGTTIKTSATKEYLHMENQVLRFVNQDTAKMIIGFENEYKSKTLNPYIILGQGDGSGKNFGSIYKDGNGVYYRYVDLNGVESNMRLTAQGNVGITAQSSMWLNSNGQIVLDGKNVVAINVSGRNVADFKQVNGVNFDLILGGNHMIRSSTAAGYDKLLQVKNVNGNEFRGLEVAEITAHGGIRSDTNLWAEQNSYAMQHINRSTEKIKTAIHDLPFSPLEKVRGLKVKEYFLKRDMYELYQMRMNKPEDRVEPYTTSDIEVQYGLIAEETDELFTTKEKDGIKLYTTLSILTAGVQELEVKHDEEIKVLEEKHSADMEEMNRRIEVLEQLLVRKLINEKPEQL
ncbi:phage tail spike protein [Bacillus mycoides]|uniref:phage tail spike protein n=1 Tax=Bacillus mycoides TaxID=1405 RepID=UPI003CFD69C2